MTICIFIEAYEKLLNDYYVELVLVKDSFLPISQRENTSSKLLIEHKETTSKVSSFMAVVVGFE